MGLIYGLIVVFQAVEEGGTKVVEMAKRDEGGEFEVRFGAEYDLDSGYDVGVQVVRPFHIDSVPNSGFFECV